MRLIGLLLITALLGACATSESTVHWLGSSSWAQAPVAPEAMNARVVNAAIEYKPHAPVPRVALFDIAFPSTEEEFKSTGGYGVLLLTAFSQDQRELPPQRLYVAAGGKKHVLEQIYSTTNQAPLSPTVVEVLGTNRWDGLYLFPVHLMDDGAVLTLDFATNRNGFVFSRFSAAERARLGYDLVQTSISPTDSAARDSIMELVAREYPGFIGRAP